MGEGDDPEVKKEKKKKKKEKQEDGGDPEVKKEKKKKKSEGGADKDDAEKATTTTTGSKPQEGENKKGWFGGGGKIFGPYVPTGDPFQPGVQYTPPVYDVIQQHGKQRIQMKDLAFERVVGKSLPPEVGYRVWLALGCRGLGVHGEEGLGTIVKVMENALQVQVKWDSTSQIHTYSSGQYGVYHLAIFEYIPRRDWANRIMQTNWAKTNKGDPPRIEKLKELEYILGYRSIWTTKALIFVGQRYKPLYHKAHLGTKDCTAGPGR